MSSVYSTMWQPWGFWPLNPSSLSEGTPTITERYCGNFISYLIAFPLVNVIVGIALALFGLYLFFAGQPSEFPREGCASMIARGALAALFGPLITLVVDIPLYYRRLHVK